MLYSSKLSVYSCDINEKTLNVLYWPTIFTKLYQEMYSTRDCVHLFLNRMPFNRVTVEQVVKISVLMSGLYKMHL